MRNFSIATVICLSTLVCSQPAKADFSLSYTSTYQSISTSKDDAYKNPEFRAYVLRLLEQDKDFPHKAALLFCKSKRLGWSSSQFIKMGYGKLLQRQALENWSESKFDAYLKILVTGMSVGTVHYCP